MPSRIGATQPVAMRVKVSQTKRNVKITLSDHLFSSDEIMTRNLPVTLDVADISIAWASMSRCQCACCVEHFMDSLESDFPEAFGYT